MSSGFPPPAQTTGYKGHGPTIIIVNAILGTIATLVVSGRLYLRFRISKNSDPSDWFMLAGLVSVCQISIFSIDDSHVLFIASHTRLHDRYCVCMRSRWTGLARSVLGSAEGYRDFEGTVNIDL